MAVVVVVPRSTYRIPCGGRVASSGHDDDSHSRGVFVFRFSVFRLFGFFFSVFSSSVFPSSVFRLSVFPGIFFH